MTLVLGQNNRFPIVQGLDLSVGEKLEFPSYCQLVTLESSRSSRSWQGKIPLRIYLGEEKKLDILAPESDPYFQVLLAPNCAFLVGTLIPAPGTQKKASTAESLDTFRSTSPVSGLKAFHLSLSLPELAHVFLKIMSQGR